MTDKNAKLCLSQQKKLEKIGINDGIVRFFFCLFLNFDLQFFILIFNFCILAA